MLAGLLGTVPVFAQTLNNQSLKGNFYFRHVSLGTDGVNPGNLTDARSLFGSITFDGIGGYTYIGQQLTGINAAVSQTGKGIYSLDPGGFLSLDSPLRAGVKINARFGPEAIIGSSTESADNTYDLFVAIPAPASGAIFNGPYNCMSLEFPGGSTANMRSTQFQLNQSALGTLQSFSVSGHVASISLGRPVTQQMPAGAATYTMGDNGQGTLSVGTPNNAQLLSGSRILYLSASGNILLGGSAAAGGHDILIGVKPVSGGTNATWNATFWGAGLRVDSERRERILGRALGGRQGQADLDQALQSARRRRLRLHRHQLLCADRRWHRNRRSHPDRSRRLGQGVRRRRHQPDRSRGL